MSWFILWNDLQVWKIELVEFYPDLRIAKSLLLAGAVSKNVLPIWRIRFRSVQLRERKELNPKICRAEIWQFVDLPKMRFKSIDVLPMAGIVDTNDKSISSEIEKKKRKANTKGWLEKKKKSWRRQRKLIFAKLHRVQNCAKLLTISIHRITSRYML